MYNAMEYDWRNFVGASLIPIDGHIFARIADNVLDTEDWSIWKLTLENGKVIKQEFYHEACYREKFVGMTREQLEKWSSEDNTGTHPEQYNELTTITP